MIYLHSKEISDKLVRHWANESESAEDTAAVYRIRQIDTGIVYDEAVDVIPCRHTYEITDEPIEKDGEADENDYMTALERFGVNDD